MGLIIQAFIILLKIARVAAGLYAMAYFIGFGFQITLEHTFREIDTALGSFPSYLSRNYHFELDMFGMDVDMSYIQASACSIIILFTFSFLIKFLELLKHKHDIKTLEAKRAKQRKELMKYSEMEKNKPDPKIYFGLFEFKLNNIGQSGEIILKKKYTKLVREKLQSKYSFLKFEGEDKLFFSGKNFSKIPPLIKDCVKLYELISDINSKKDIKTNLVCSLLAQSENNDSKDAQNILEAIAGLNVLNKIVANGDLCNYLKKIKIKDFNFSVLGVIKLIDVPKEGEDFNLELFRLTNSQKL